MTMDEDNHLINDNTSSLELEESNIDKQLRISNSYASAENLLNIVQKETITDLERAAVFLYLPTLDWGAVDLYDSDNRDLLDRNACSILFDWLLTVAPDMSEDEKLAVMQATLGLDGAYSEGFAGLMVRIFDRDRTGFFQTLSGIQQMEKAEETVRLLAYGCIYKNEEEMLQIKNELNEHLASPEPNIQEEHLVNLFLGYSYI